MNYNLNDIYVNKHNPFFTADKWNSSLDYSKNFENMISKLLGGPFKGIYKPFLSYNVYDYVWFNENYYQITDSNNTDIEFMNKNNYRFVSHYKDDFYIGLNELNKIVLFNKANIISISTNTFEKIYCFGDEIVGLFNQKLYKVDIVKKTTTPINYIFSRTINDVKMDKFQIYIVSNNMVEVGNSLNNDLTETKKLYETNRRIVDMTMNNSQILILLDNNNVEIINKSTGKKEGFFIVSQNLNLLKVKTLCIDDYSYLVYDGNDKLLTFSNNGKIYTYYSFIQNENFVGSVSLTYNDNYIVTVNNRTISKLIATRYNLSIVDIKSIIIKDLTSNKSKVVAEYIDFSKGQYETDNLKPIVSKIKAHNNKGVAIQAPLSYNYNLSGKAIMVRGESVSTISGNIFNIKLGTKLINVPASNMFGENYFVVLLFDNKYKLVHYHNNVKDVSVHNYSISGSSEYKFTFESSAEYILNNFIIFNSSKEAEEVIDFYYKNDLSSFDIQPSVKSYPYSYVKTDQNGNINLNIQDRSIVKSDNGFKVNMSSDTSLRSKDIALNMEGANVLRGQIDTALNTKQNMNDNSLGTKAKNIVGAINELLANKVENSTFLNKVKEITNSITRTNNDLTDTKNNLWKIRPKSIGNSSTPFDLNNLRERGFYVSTSSANKFINCPLGSQGAFELTVTGITNTTYCTQTLKEIGNNNYWVRTQTNWQTPWTWSSWQKIPLNDDVANEIKQKAERMPIGTIIDYPTASAIPVGFLPLDGREILQAHYPDLYSILAMSSNSRKYLPKIVTLVETGENGQGKWRIYSDGYMEQWGRIYMSGGYGRVNMPKAFKDLNYTASGSHFMTYAIHGWGVNYINSQVFDLYGHNYENSYTQHFSGTTNWKASGYTNNIPLGTTRKIIKALNVDQTQNTVSPVITDVNNKIDANRKEVEQLKSRLDNYIPKWG